MKVAKWESHANRTLSYMVRYYSVDTAMGELLLLNGARFLLNLSKVVLARTEHIECTMERWMVVNMQGRREGCRLLGNSQTKQQLVIPIMNDD